MGRKRTHCAICNRPLTDEEINKQQRYCQDCMDEEEMMEYDDMDSSYNPFISQEENDRRQEIVDSIDNEYEKYDNYEDFSEIFDDDEDESEYYDDLGFDSYEDAAVDDEFRNEIDIWDESINKALFAEIHKNATKLKESRALPGGNLDSGEVTDYEKWLEKIHNKQDKAKNKEDPNWAPRIFDKECSENGYHDWDGKKLKSVQEFIKQYNKK